MSASKEISSASPQEFDLRIVVLFSNSREYRLI